MISIISFIVVIFGSVNWLSIGFFQYDLVAGLFGYQGSIFSRIVYIFIGICAIYLVFSVIKHKGKISAKRLKKEEKLPLINNKEDKSQNETNENKSQNNNDAQSQNNNQTNTNTNNSNNKENSNNSSNNTNNN